MSRIALRFLKLIVFSALCWGVLFAGTASSVLAEHPLKLLHYWTGPLSGGIDEMVAEYNARSPVSPIEAVGMDHESFKAGIKGLLASGQRPQLFSYWAGARTQYMVDAGYLAPIDEAWNAAGLDRVFPHAVAETCVYNGKRYALPVTQHVVGFFFNRNLFSSLNITPPETWDEFIEVCRTLKRAGIAPLSLGNRERWPAQFWFDYLLLRTAGPDYRDRLVKGKASYLDPQVQHAFTLWQQLIDEGFFSPATGKNDWAGAAKEVHLGKAAMTLIGTWVMGYYGEQLGWKEMQDYDFFEFPLIDPGIRKSFVGPIDVLVVARGNNGDIHGLDEALMYFARVRLQEVMSAGSGALAPSGQVPLEFYGPLKRRLAEVVQRAELWNFAYDLAVPPAAADVGLGLFAAFLRQNQDLGMLLKSTQQRMEFIYGQH
ncbi:extracellular solute-binding protein [Desulfovibrio subterraneus]|uniref:ABC transporter substrate-binding protein n=1 Tax=Desulfovibrio subterraneus TaxID=2718620 RepID=A0A7J0BJ11_9BACT|nr:extracellular solute-binding protein [Desulfovibrio subterraneus]GFM33686.1 ABC transporter substrate-binding protein [Desulfovibrio subterraneus]